MLYPDDCKPEVGSHSRPQVKGTSDLDPSPLFGSRARGACLQLPPLCSLQWETNTALWGISLLPNGPPVQTRDCAPVSREEAWQDLLNNVLNQESSTSYSPTNTLEVLSVEVGERCQAVLHWRALVWPGSCNKEGKSTKWSPSFSGLNIWFRGSHRHGNQCVYHHVCMCVLAITVALAQETKKKRTDKMKLIPLARK